MLEKRKTQSENFIKDQGSGLHSSLPVNNEDLTLTFTEKWYQKRWCRDKDGQVEVVLPCKTRCDCVTDTHAIEFDFANQLTGP